MVLFERSPILSHFNTPTTHEYQVRVNLNLYDSPLCQDLATQAAAGRQLRVLRQAQEAVEVCLCEDNYSGWLLLQDLAHLELTTQMYQPKIVSRAEIEAKIAEAIAFTKAALLQPNYYLWGGTVAPNYDCSGLMQAAFASVGIWLPRDSYQQEAFTQRLSQEELLPGDLVFFGTPEKINHVGLYLGDDSYIHSSGKEIGRNGIGIDKLSVGVDEVSQTYYKLLRSFGRITCSYQPLSSGLI